MKSLRPLAVLVVIASVAGCLDYKAPAVKVSAPKLPDHEAQATREIFQPPKSDVRSQPVPTVTITAPTISAPPPAPTTTATPTNGETKPAPEPKPTPSASTPKKS